METRVIKIKDIPTDKKPIKRIHVKPTGELLCLIAIGILLCIFRPNLIVFGILLVIMPGFALIALPDRLLAQFTPEYLVFFNQKDRQFCTMMPWSDIVNWQYEYYRSNDILRVTLVDGRSEEIPMYSKMIVSRYMNQYAPKKEIRSTRMKGNA